MTTAPDGSASAMPPSMIAWRTIAPLGSIVTTASTSAKSAGPLAAVWPCSFAHRWASSGSASMPTTS